jgi:hypothetical protein
MPEDRRSADVNLKEMAGKPEADAVIWWKTRMTQVAAIPVGTARAGALIPMMRELAALPKPQRVALTRARVLAVSELPQDQVQKIFEARAIAARQAPELEAEDDAFVRDEVIPALPREQAERVTQVAVRAGMRPEQSSGERR